MFVIAFGGDLYGLLVVGATIVLTMIVVALWRRR